jgi:hypothetical protein
MNTHLSGGLLVVHILERPAGDAWLAGQTSLSALKVARKNRKLKSFFSSLVSEIEILCSV